MKDIKRWGCLYFGQPHEWVSGCIESGWFFPDGIQPMLFTLSGTVLSMLLIPGRAPPVEPLQLL